MCCLREEELWVGTRKLTLLPTKACFRNYILHLFSCSETQSDTDMNVIHAEVFIRVTTVLKACYPQMIGLCHEQTVWGFLLIKTVIRRIFFSLPLQHHMSSEPAGGLLNPCGHHARYSDFKHLDGAPL